MATICRACAHYQDTDQIPARCAYCGSPRLTSHAELGTLYIAHIDCDAFYASVEKRDNRDLKDKPVIVGGGKRGVVSACCYIARLKGIHSAMPMYQARKLCPDATVIRPDMEKYSRIGRTIRELMLEKTPLVEPLSVDEAFLDLSGTEKLHNAFPAETLVRLVNRIEDEIGITASIGLSYNKFLAKTASDLDKPRGFALIGRAEAISFLTPRHVGSIWGVGKSLRAKLARDGISTIGQLREMDAKVLTARYGTIGNRLSRLSRGEDTRRVDPRGKAKSISSESTFGEDIKDFDQLCYRLWPLCEKVARRLVAKNMAATAISLKLKTSSFQILTRSKQLQVPTQLAEFLYQSALPILEKEANGTRYRLIGIGATSFAKADEADKNDLLDDRPEEIAKIENAMADVRAKFGTPSINKGRSLLSESHSKSNSKSKSQQRSAGSSSN